MMSEICRVRLSVLCSSDRAVHVQLITLTIYGQFLQNILCQLVRTEIVTMPDIYKSNSEFSQQLVGNNKYSEFK